MIADQLMIEFLYTFYTLARMPSALPRNIQFLLKKYQSKMTGNSDKAINAIKESVQKFNYERSESLQLRTFQIHPHTNQNGLENQQLYIVRITGRKNTFYQRRILKFYLLILDTYPLEPPLIFAGNCIDSVKKIEKPFLHINVAQNGQFCLRTNQKNEQYFDYTTLKDILIDLQETIYYPNIASSYNNQLYHSYKTKGENSTYYQLLNAQAKLLSENSASSESEDQFN